MRYLGFDGSVYVCWLKYFSGYLHLGEAEGKADQMSRRALQNWGSGTHLTNSRRKCGNTVWVHPGLGKGHAKERRVSWKPVMTDPWKPLMAWLWYQRLVLTFQGTSVKRLWRSGLYEGNNRATPRTATSAKTSGFLGP